MSKRIIHFFLAGLLFFMGSTGLMAEDTPNLQSLLKKRIDIIAETMKNDGLNLTQKNNIITEFIEDIVDFQLMARLSLVRDQWARLDEKTRQAYTDLFVKRIRESYLDKMNLYTDEKIEVKPEVKTKKNRIEVPTYIIGKGEPTEVLFKFYKTQKGEWKIYDLQVSGVSIIQTYRSQFSEILKTSSFDGLLEKLKTSRSL